MATLKAGSELIGISSKQWLAITKELNLSLETQGEKYDTGVGFEPSNSAFSKKSNNDETRHFRHTKYGRVSVQIVVNSAS